MGADPDICEEAVYKKMYMILKENCADAQLSPLFSYSFYIFSGFQDRRTIDLLSMSNCDGHILLELMFFSFFGELPDAQISDYWAHMAEQWPADVYRGKMLLSFSKSYKGLLALKKITGLKDYPAPWRYKVQILLLRTIRFPLIRLIALMPERTIAEIRKQRRKKRMIR